MGIAFRETRWRNAMLVVFSCTNGVGPNDRIARDILTKQHERAGTVGQFDGGKTTVSGGTVGALEPVGANRLGA